DALRRQGGVWFGWSGEIGPSTAVRTVQSGAITYAVTDLTQSEHDLYYVGYANTTLWPLLHYRLGLVEYRQHEFDGYWRVNEAFAERLCPLLKADDVLWVHDYHLIPLAAALRARGVGNRIGFFLHTPLPVPEVLGALPQHERLMRALFQYDLIGVQTAREVHAVQAYARELAGGTVREDGGITAFGHASRVAAFPIGIETEAFAAQAVTAEKAVETRRMRDSLNGRAMLIGVDRLDYSKGIPQRFEAMDRLLSGWAEHRGAITYLQITPHSRASVSQYRALRRQIEAAAGRINGKFAEFDWAPIRYVNRSFGRTTLAGFYRLARIGLVTPLRDGMNLVAKEFVAAQNPDDPGVLVLSRFAGAAQELDAALLVNPLDTEDMAATLHRALTMARSERRACWERLMAALRANTIDTWRQTYLAALTGEAPARQVSPSRPRMPARL
ncbi:MAG: trehalose-6-phosphate synthase, partial [Rhodospirillales bacterium]|nr:trehalose-6-phosphate synthase [Rhodospirillales bacterium]